MSLPELVLYGIGVISKVVEAILAAQSGKLTPEQALQNIQAATHQDRSVDAKVDAALDAKFPEEP